MIIIGEKLNSSIKSVREAIAARDAAFIGELSLSGELRPVQGALPMALSARRQGIRTLYLPAENAPEAAFAEGLEVCPVRTVTELLAHLRGESPIAPASAPDLRERSSRPWGWRSTSLRSQNSFPAVSSRE